MWLAAYLIAPRSALRSIFDQVDHRSCSDISISLFCRHITMTQANTTTPPQVPASESSAGPSSNLTSSGNLYGQFAAPIRCYERVNVQSICAFCGATTSCYISLPSSCYPPAAERTWGFPLGPEYGSFIIDYAYSAYELPLRYSSLSNAEVSSSWHDDVYRFSGSAAGCL